MSPYLCVSQLKKNVMEKTMIKHRFTEGDIVRHKTTKVIGVVEELTSIEKMNYKRSLQGMGGVSLWVNQPYYKVMWGKDNVNNDLWLSAGLPDDGWDGQSTIIGEDLLVKPMKTLGVVKSYTKVSQLKGLFLYEIYGYKLYDDNDNLVRSMHLCITEKGTGKEVQYIISCDSSIPTVKNLNDIITLGIGIKSNDQVMIDYVYQLYSKELDKLMVIRG